MSASPHAAADDFGATRAARERLAARTEATRGVLIVGLGGLGCPALSVLAKSGVTRFTLLDDDTVDVTNLQRQSLYEERDVGRLKVEVAAERAAALSPTPERVRCERIVDRLLPDQALELARGHVLLVEGADNFATKFLAADCARLSGVPIAQAGAVRFNGWALASDQGGACARCVFEDIPRGLPETCAAAGVLGPVVGVLGALQGALALSLLLGSDVAGTLYRYEGLGGRLRRHRFGRRADCALCSGQIRDLTPERYFGACAA